MQLRLVVCHYGSPANLAHLSEEKRLRWLPYSRNLRTALLIRVVLPVFLMLGLLLVVALEIVAQLTEERLQRDLQQVARAVQMPVAQALERSDLEQLSNSLESIFDINEVYGAYVFDVNGVRLVSFGSVRPSQSQTYRAVELTVDIEQEFDQYEQISGRDVYSFFLPLFDTAGRPNGLLQVTRRRSDIESELTLLRRWAWSGFGVLLAVMLGSLMWTHHRVIGKPVTRLLDSMRRVESGDSHYRAPMDGPREIRQLAGRLNSMLDSIQTAEAQARSELEARQVMAGKLRHAETMAVLGQLSGGVAHELGAPLSVVDGRAARLLRNCDKEEERRELEAIRTQVSRMSALVEQLLSFGRNSRAPMEEVDVAELFERVFRYAREEGWEPELLPGETVSVRGDMMSLEQALGNLLRNACQACPDGRVRAGWQLEADHRVSLFVEDAGPGIAEDMRHQIFEPFVTNKMPGEGSGMGLAIARRVASDHSGDISVAESPLGGARFVMSLPVSQEGADE